MPRDLLAKAENVFCDPSNNLQRTKRDTEVERDKRQEGWGNNRERQ